MPQQLRPAMRRDYIESSISSALRLDQERFAFELWMDTTEQEEAARGYVRPRAHKRMWAGHLPSLSALDPDTSFGELSEAIERLIPGDVRGWIRDRRKASTDDADWLAGPEADSMRLRDLQSAPNPFEPRRVADWSFSISPDHMASIKRAIGDEFDRLVNAGEPHDAVLCALLAVAAERQASHLVR